MAGRNLILGSPIDVYEAARGDLVQTVVASGRIITPRRVSIGVVITGRVARIPVQEGQTVQFGKPGDQYRISLVGGSDPTSSSPIGAPAKIAGYATLLGSKSAGVPAFGRAERSHTLRSPGLANGNRLPFGGSKISTALGFLDWSRHGIVRRT